MEKEGYFSKNFDKIILFVFVLVVLFVYSYKLGSWFYDFIPYVFFFGMISAILFNIVGILMFPMAVLFQTLFWATLTFLPGSITTLYSLVALGILISVGLYKQKDFKFKKDTNLFFILILILMLMISTLFNGLPINFKNYEFIHFVEAFLIFFIVNAFVSNNKRLKLFSWILFFGVISLAFRAYNHTYAYDVAIPGFENNYLARLFAFYVPFFIGLFWAEKKRYLKILALLGVAFTAQSITQLGSRATYVAVGVAGALLFIWNIRKKSIWVIAGFGLILLMFFTNEYFVRDIYSIPQAAQGTESEEASISMRFEVLEYGWETFKQRPVLGYGVDHQRFEKLMQARYGIYRSGHNSYVIIAVEMGIFGLISYIGLFVFSILLCYKAQRLAKNKNNYVYSIANGTMFGLVALGINQYMLNNPWISTAFIGFGLSSALYYMAKNGENIEVQDIEEKKKDKAELFFTESVASKSIAKHNNKTNNKSTHSKQKNKAKLKK